MAMLPFCGYHMGDYFEHWLNMGKRMAKPPRIFNVNWFRTDENEEFLWPGFGENLRVIEWILDRCRGEADAIKTPIGYVPAPDSLDLTGLDISDEQLEQTVCHRPRRLVSRNGERCLLLPRLRRAVAEDHVEAVGVAPAAASFARLADEARCEVRSLAADLNEVIERENPHVHGMLSELGKRLYFPRGILAQSAEAKDKATRYNATIGIAKEDGQPMFLPSVMRYFNELTPAEALTYAPATGRPDLRHKWREELLRKNPSLADKSFSMPIVTSGVTHALSWSATCSSIPATWSFCPTNSGKTTSFCSACVSGPVGVVPVLPASGGFNTPRCAKPWPQGPEVGRPCW